ncbi:hypothetical protein ACFL47_08710 [Candidatus Latescibacterota bacterium]
MSHTELSAEQKGCIEEFRAIREEMMYALRSRIWGVASYAVIAGGLLAYAEKQSTSWPYIVTIASSLPFIVYTTYLERIRLRIHYYIKTIIEPQVPGMAWEKYLSRWRKKIRKKWAKPFDRCRYIFSILGIYDILAFLCLYRIYIIQESTFEFVLAVALFILVLVGNAWFYSILIASKKYDEIFSNYRKELLSVDDENKYLE